jgi:hypothetical protein
VSADVLRARNRSDRPAGRRPRPWRLSRAWRRGTLTVHIVSAGAWLGIDVIVAVLVVAGWFADDVALRSLAYRALAVFVVWPMLAAGLVCLLTGVVLGLGSKWGLFRYWWVVIKLLLNLVLCTLVLVALQPGMDDVYTYGEQLLNGDPERSAVATLFFPPAVSLSALSIAVWLGVAKPWGRLRRAHRPRIPTAEEAGG